MSLDRRGFLLGSAAATAGLAVASPSLAVDIPDPKRGAILKLSSQVGVIPGDSLDEKLAKMQAWGFAGVEPHGNVVGQAKEFLAAVAKTDLKVSAVCWGSHGGDLVSEDAEKRRKGVEDLKRALETAGELHSTGVIYVPAFKNETNRTNQEIRKLLVDEFPGDWPVRREREFPRLV